MKSGSSFWRSFCSIAHKKWMAAGGGNLNEYNDSLLPWCAMTHSGNTDAAHWKSRREALRHVLTTSRPVTPRRGVNNASVLPSVCVFSRYFKFNSNVSRSFSVFIIRRYQRLFLDILISATCAHSDPLKLHLCIWLNMGTEGCLN